MQRHDYAKAKRKIWRLYRVRCSKCEHRCTFKKHPDFFEKLPACPYCKSRKWRVDWFRTSKKEGKRYLCKCGALGPSSGTDGRDMPHRRGSTRVYEGYALECVHRVGREQRSAA